jgi:hypothetical protein
MRVKVSVCDKNTLAYYTVAVGSGITLIKKYIKQAVVDTVGIGMGVGYSNLLLALLQWFFSGYSSFHQTK